ncbi:hypothetical protein FOL47_005737 [Perkinsus chesapeaki]|uniref:Uncharacterized protein n=1 Tax=Perkinsus chesapeaki TaxID=330153 RepID=A0A7J6LW86_PERCH|nr:hypothetical protein FOL47_005737 [Perkinsus chesapeaki]
MSKVIRLSPTEADDAIRCNRLNERRNRLRIVRQGEKIRSKRLVSRNKIDRVISNRNNEDYNIINTINKHKEELKELIKTRDGIKVSLNEGHNTALRDIGKWDKKDIDCDIIKERYNSARKAINRERLKKEVEDNNNIERIIMARYDANKLSTTYKVKKPLLYPNDDIFINMDKRSVNNK